jgi:hypothetical protein
MELLQALNLVKMLLLLLSLENLSKCVNLVTRLMFIGLDSKSRYDLEN